jgi:hypothetical protein
VLEFALSILAAIGVFFRSRSDTALEVLTLRQQIAMIQGKQPRPILNSSDLLFWTTLRRSCSRWTDVLVIVKPEPVIGRQGAGFVSTGCGVPGPAAAGRRSLLRFVF